MADNSVAIIGLGSMGQGMAVSLIRAGFTVYGFDLSEQQCQLAQQNGVEICPDIASLCQRTGNILLSLPMAKHVQQVVTGDDGLLASARDNSLIIDTSTSEPEVTRALAKQLAEAGHQLLDSPVSGGPSGAAAGTMVMVVGGELAAVERATAIFQALSSKMVHLGPSGNGHVAKLINNLLCAAHLITTAEAVALGEKAGLDANKLIEGLNAGSGRSAISEVNFPRWVLNQQFDSGFTMGLMRKDVRLARALIDSLSLQLPLSEQVSELWSQSEQNLADDLDFNRIINNTQG